MGGGCSIENERKGVRKPKKRRKNIGKRWRGRRKKRGRRETKKRMHILEYF